MMNIYLNRWSRASLICRQTNEGDRFEYKVVDAIIRFVKNGLGLRRKTT